MAVNIKKLVNEIHKEIVLQNGREDSEAIPHSDQFIKRITSSIGIDANTCLDIIGMLKEAHKILIFEISKENIDQKIEKIDGYIDADLHTLKKLKLIYHKILEEIYEDERRQKKNSFQIIRELIMDMGRISRTQLGMILNKAVMLDEFDKLIEKEFGLYTENWKAGKLEVLIKEYENHNAIEGTQEKKADVSASVNDTYITKRAVDMNPVDTTGKFSVNKMIQIYGVEFFFRVNLRKYNFDLISELIESRQLNRRSDLKLLKDMLQKIKQNTNNDTKLNEYIDKIAKLERAISRNLTAV